MSGHEVVPGVHRIELDLGERIVCSYAVVGDERVLVLDTGLSGSVESELLPYLAQAGIDASRIEVVVTSHADVDHSGGNAALARAIQGHAMFMCHVLDQPMIADVGTLNAQRYECFREGHGIDFGGGFSEWVRDNAEHVPIDVWVQGSERVRLGGDRWVEVLHTPGHSAGHLSLWLAEQRTAIISDAVLGVNVPTRDGHPFSPPTYRYVDAYLESIARIESLDPEVLLTGHYPVLRGEEVTRFLADSREFVEALDTQVASLLDSAALTTPDLISRIDCEPHGWPAECHANLIFPLAGHLERLEEKGAIVADRSESLTMWRAA